MTPAAHVQLAVTNLTSGYGPVTILRDVSLEVRAGEIVAVLGANGAGKSTLLKTIVGLLSPSAGTIEVEGAAVTGQPPEALTRRGIVLIPEGRQLFDTMTVRENLILGGYVTPRAQRSELMHDVLELFPILAERMSQRVSTMSGGQRQMVALGRALMGRPSLLLLDEPSLGLAPLVVKETFEALDRLRGGGVTIVLVEQNAALALDLADRAYVLQRGRVAVEEQAARLARDPRIREAYLGREALRE